MELADVMSFSSMAVKVDVNVVLFIYGSHNRCKCSSLSSFAIEKKPVQQNHYFVTRYSAFK